MSSRLGAPQSTNGPGRILEKMTVDDFDAFLAGELTLEELKVRYGFDPNAPLPGGRQ